MTLHWTDRDKAKVVNKFQTDHMTKFGHLTLVHFRVLKFRVK